MKLSRNSRLVEDTGVLPSLTALSGSRKGVVCLLGVTWIPTTVVVVGPPVEREGVAVSGGRRSKRPRTRPSLCGVGPMEVGTAGLKSLRAVDGVVTASTYLLDACGVCSVRTRFDGAGDGASIGLRFLGAGSAFSSAVVFPAKMSRTLL